MIHIRKIKHKNVQGNLKILISNTFQISSLRRESTEDSVLEKEFPQKMSQQSHSDYSLYARIAFNKISFPFRIKLIFRIKCNRIRLYNRKILGFQLRHKWRKMSLDQTVCEGNFSKMPANVRFYCSVPHVNNPLTDEYKSCVGYVYVETNDIYF